MGCPVRHHLVTRVFPSSQESVTALTRSQCSQCSLGSVGVGAEVFGVGVFGAEVVGAASVAGDAERSGLAGSPDGAGSSAPSRSTSMRFNCLPMLRHRSTVAAPRASTINSATQPGFTVFGSISAVRREVVAVTPPVSHCLGFLPHPTAPVTQPPVSAAPRTGHLQAARTRPDSEPARSPRSAKPPGAPRAAR